MKPPSSEGGGEDAVTHELVPSFPELTCVLSCPVWFQFCSVPTIFLPSSSCGFRFLFFHHLIISCYHSNIFMNQEEAFRSI